jgi:hypothetical protein
MTVKRRRRGDSRKVSIINGGVEPIAMRGDFQRLGNNYLSSWGYFIALKNGELPYLVWLRPHPNTKSFLNVR